MSVPFLIRTSVPLDQGPILKTSPLLTSLKALSPYSVPLELMASAYEFLGVGWDGAQFSP